MSIVYPTRITDVPDDGELLAGGTDLGERMRSGSAPERLVDLSRLPGLRAIDVNGEGASVGALVTVADVGAHLEIGRRYPGLSEVCRTLATPQIRTRATMGGVLCQRTRCWYYRHPAFSCFKSGGAACPAREGNNLYGVAFDLGPCVYPHPSSVALALLAYDGVVETSRRASLTPRQLFGDGSDPTRDHHLDPGELLTGIRLPDPGGEAPSSYVRLMSRSWAEWPLVECVVRLRAEHGVLTVARVAVGGVANVPLRLPSVEEQLVGGPADRARYERAAGLAAEGSAPLPGAQDKRAMIRATVLEALERALPPR